MYPTRIISCLADVQNLGRAYAAITESIFACEFRVAGRISSLAFDASWVRKKGQRRRRVAVLVRSTCGDEPDHAGAQRWDSDT